jgi:uncharacterized protein YdhG (YjbR/CyaY superfamily)
VTVPNRNEAATAQIDEAVQDYIDAVAPEHRPLFDRVHQILLDEHPDVVVVLKYNMPTYELGQRGLHVAVWRHGLSLYGWGENRDAGFTKRHPEITGDKGTIRLTPKAAADIDDDELRAFLRATLAG